MSNSSNKIRQTVLCALFISALTAKAQFRSYEIYQPQVTRGFIVDTSQNELKYNHCTSIQRYRGRFYCFWNANTVYKEGEPGQLLYMATSLDGMNWSEPVNWTPDNGRKQWQPCTINIDDESLWVFWQETGGPFWFSKLTDPEGAWTHRMIFTKTMMPDGLEYNPAATQDPLRLSNGRICQTVTWVQISGGPNKFSGIVYTNNGGQSFNMDTSSFVWDPIDGTKSFESMLVEQYDGNIRMFIRNLDRTSQQDELFMTSLGDENAENFYSPAQFSKTRTVSSRCWVKTIGQRKIMLLNDSANGTPELAGHDRKNIAMFFSRSGMDDFAAGVPVVDYEPELAYPQAVEHDNKLYFTYSHENSKNIRWGIVDPLPADDKYYIFPRGTDRRLTDHDDGPVEVRVEKFNLNGDSMLRFYGNASAGVDIDICEPQNDVLKIRLPVFLESTPADKRMRLLCVGDGEVQLGYDAATPYRYQVLIDDTWYDAGAFDPAKWNDILLIISSNGVATQNMGSALYHPAPSGFNGRVYIGDGYPEEFLDETSRFIVNIERFGSLVEAASESGFCGDNEHPIISPDLNYDCIIDLYDFSIMAKSWLKDADK
ncbi:putative neuraminidase (sialidase) [Limihaloglobus sulfuriphilus]|uniref:Putative neuraminidase (Sialidase) n=1 Tax=Limihaloglobus sulfuriphilus TaxID=1851148 RepID=A0A1Q2MFK0_9BACT|nr:sialidase family protein [Limihaloglobus sulfuriphilus]AQQ71485.1 putative neuraminidase (sialidase) [Limihaloglobus sulfuriphilus]